MWFLGGNVNLKDFLDRLGLNGTWWQWRLMRWQEAWRDRWRAVEDGRRVATYQHKFCPACNALLDRTDTQCPRCGARAPSWAGDALRRTLGLVLPRWNPVSSILVGMNLLDLLVVLAVFGFSNLLQPESSMLRAMGALDPARIWDGEPWRLITYGYLHIGLMHLAFNLIALSQVGPVLEEQVGSARFFAVYTLALIGGGVAALWARGPAGPLVAGASGALFGLIGFGMAYAHFYGGAAGRAQRNFFLHWAVYGFLFGFVVRADNVCHFGGFLTGCVAGFAVERERANRDRFTPLWRGLATACGVLTAVAFGALALAR